jgi:O-acetyl-ADP-ribose deacetylase (regulator of RNase III)
MKISLLKGDITKVACGAIVNAANCSLLGGGGVDGAIHRAAGPELLEACRKFGGCKTGEAVVTPAFNLPCEFVIHTPGPIWKGGAKGEPELLRSCYLNSLRLAAERSVKDLAFPCVSTGVYHYPKDKAAALAVETVRSWIAPLPKEVVFVVFDEESFELYKKLLGPL